MSMKGGLFAKPTLEEFEAHLRDALAEGIKRKKRIDRSARKPQRAPSLAERLFQFKNNKLAIKISRLKQIEAERRYQKRKLQEQQITSRANEIKRRRENGWSLEKQRRSTVDWTAYLPPDIAIKQVAWERIQTVLAMRRSGLTLACIGEKFGLSTERIRQMEAKAGRRSQISSPAELWFAANQGFQIYGLKEAKAMASAPIPRVVRERDWLMVATH